MPAALYQGSNERGRGYRGKVDLCQVARHGHLPAACLPWLFPRALVNPKFGLPHAICGWRMEGAARLVQALQACSPLSSAYSAHYRKGSVRLTVCELGDSQTHRSCQTFPLSLSLSFYFSLSLLTVSLHSALPCVCSLSLSRSFAAAAAGTQAALFSLSLSA